MSEPAAAHRLVNASAGTGKTYRLTLEYLRLLDRGQPPQTILATTFTRKAAGEILERILLRLADSALDDHAAATLGSELGDPTLGRSHAGALLVGLCAELNRLAVGTLDAFLLQLVSICRLELGLSPRPQLAPPEDPRAVRLRAQALERVLESQASSDFETLLELVDRLHDDEARASVAAALDRVLLQLYDQYREAPEASVWCRLQEPAGRLADPALDELLREHDDLTLRLGSTFSEVLRADRARIARGQWEELLAKGLGQAVLSRPAAPTYRRAELPRAAVGVYQRLLAHTRAVVVGRLARRAAATHELLRLFHVEFDLLRRERGLLLFSDLPHLVRERLAEHTPERLLELQYRLDGRVSHLLLDEFQDTSLEQWRVIEPFAEEILAWGDGSRSFFCVGDPKQAIYGWRGGRTELFDVVAARLRERGGELETQVVCYRSAPLLIETTDRVCRALLSFPPLAPERELVGRWVANLHPLVPAEAQRPGRVELHLLPGLRPTAGALGAPPAGDEDTAGTAEPYFDAVAELVAGLAARGCGTIGVLARTNRRVLGVLDALRRRGVAASGEGGGPLIDDPLVVLLLEVLQLADHPSDTVAAFHLRQSPLASALGLDTEPVLAVAERWRAEVLARGPAVVLAGLAAQLRPFADGRSALRLRQLLELTERYQATLGLRASELLELAALAEVEEPSPARMRVMTIHKSKGLEFDAVVLCELDAPLGDSRDLVTMSDRGEATAPPAAIYPWAPAAVRGLLPELERVHGKERERRLWDDLSTLYVALTRARSGLYLLVPEPAPRQRRANAAELLLSVLAPGPAGDRGGLLWAGGDAEWWRGSATVAAPVADEPEPAPAVRRQPAVTAARNLAIVEPSLQGAGRNEVDARELLRFDSEPERLRGTILHAWLAQVEYLPLGERLDKLALRPVARALAPRLSAQTLERWLDELELAIEQPEVRARLVAPPSLRRGETVELWREKPFARVVGGELWSGRFDRVVIHRRGERFLGAELVDWKSDPLRGDQVAAAAAAYRPQLDAYRQAVAALLGLLPTAVRSYFVFLTPGRAVALEEAV